MNIREATETDVPQLIELGKVMTKESPVFSQLTPDYEKQAQIFAAAIESLNACVFIVEDGTGMFVGHVEGSPWFEEFFAVEDVLFVLPEYRGTSRAIKLIKAFESWVQSKGLKHIHTGVSTEVKLESSTRFYEKMGYKQSGVLFKKEI